MSIPVMPGTHTWVQGGPVLGRAGARVPLYASDSDEIWVWDEDTNTRVTDLLDADANPVTSAPISDGWVDGIGVPVAVAVPSFSVGQFGKRMSALPVQTLRDASASLAPTDAQVATLITPGSGSASEAVLDSTIAAAVTAGVAPKAAQADLDDVIDGTTVLPYVPAQTVNALPNPSYIAHRGGGWIAPEETMEAFRTSVACGADAIEMDIQPLGDGSLAVMHDTTVDRTTDGTGVVSGFTAPAWRSLNAAAKFPWNGKSTPPALLTEVLAEFSNKTPMMIEPKDADNATQVMDLVEAVGGKASVILATSERTVLQACAARGFITFFYWASTTSSPTVADIVADGANYLGIDGIAASDATISGLVSTGLAVLPYTIERRLTKAHLATLGVAGYLTDQPAYLRASTAQRTVDSWRQGVLGHGVLPSTSVLPGVVSQQLSLDAASVQYAVIGEVCPLANAAGSYTIDVDLGFSTLPADTSRAAVVNFGISDDGGYSYNSASTFSDGYAIWLRANGSLGLFKMTKGVGSTALGSAVSTTALTAGVLAHLRVAVTPAGVTITRTDSGGFAPITQSDATYRGGYVSLGKSSTDGVARFKNLAIT